MEIFINNHASIPIYEQISSQIKALIINGELKAGEALPSIRGLAKSLHISVLTVQKSYDVLQKDGFIRSEEHTSELQSRFDLVCRLLLEKKNNIKCKSK